MTLETWIRPAPCTAYLAAPGLVEPLLEELGGADAVHWVQERLILAPGEARPAAWAQNIWYEPQFLPLPSIGAGVRALKALQRNWALYPLCEHRRAALLAEQLPRVAARPLVFGDPAPTAALGSWTLLDRETLLAAPRCSSPFAHGEPQFVEDKSGPPNRAYLKLWELFTLLGRRPRAGAFCLDLGGSPGGWAWVLAGLGARVLSVDKAPLDKTVAQLPGVAWQQGSAFAFDARALQQLAQEQGQGRVDWLFSDVICYPERLLTHVRRWLESGVVHNFVCTIKFQGATDHATAQAFAAIPGSRLLHLGHNKHELTWLLLDATKQ